MADAAAPAPARGERAAVAVVAVVACVPLVVALIRAVREGWYPAGDNAYFSLRARDVLTGDHPLLGTWTSASLSADRSLNNPGPLLFDLLALPSKVDHRYGVAAGAVLVNLGATVGCVLAGWWTGGRRVALFAAAMAASLGWVLGSGLVVDPWQPHNLLLPALCALVLAWGVVAGRTVLWPWLIGVGSLLVQTHLPYGVLVAGLLVLGVVATWRAGLLAVPRWRGGGAPRHLLVALAVGLVLWLQPLVDQVSGRGNLGALASSVGSTGDTTGAGYGARLAATVLAAPGLWARDGFARAFVPAELQAPGVAGPDVTLQEVPSGGAALGGLVLLAVVLAAAGWLGHRRGDREASAGVITASVAVGLAWFTASSLPIGELGLGPHQLRFLWPVGIFVTGCVALAIAGRSRAGQWSAIAATAVVVVLGLPAHPAEVGPSSERTAIAVLDELAPQLAELDPDLTYFVDSERSRLFEPYTTPLMLELQANGSDFTVSYVYTVPQVGEGRRDEGRADRTLAVVEGPGALNPPAGQELVASVAGLDPDERREMERLRGTVAADVAERGVALTADGERAASLGLLPSLASGGSRPAPEDLLRTGELVRMVRRGYLDLPADMASTYRRWADLQQRWSTGTVGVWMGPPPDR